MDTGHYEVMLYSYDAEHGEQEESMGETWTNEIDAREQARWMVKNGLAVTAKVYHLPNHEPERAQGVAVFGA